MADINLSLGLELDASALASIKKELDALKANINVNVGGGGSSGGGGSTKSATDDMKEFAEALAEIKTRMRDAETEFRKMALAERDVAKATQTNSATLEDLQKAQLATKTAKENAISVIKAEENALESLASQYSGNAIALDKISIAQKSAVEAGQRVKVGFIGMATALDDLNTSHKTANNLLLELGRGFSDAGMFAVDFRMGLLAVSNNISQVVDVGGRLIQNAKAQAEAMQAAGKSASAMRIAIDGLKTSLMGVGGFILAINLALTAIQLWPKATKEAEEGSDAFAQALGRLKSEFEKVNTAITNAQEKLGMIGGSDIEKTEASLKRATDALSQQQAILTDIANKKAQEKKDLEDSIVLLRSGVEQQQGNLEAQNSIRKTLSEKLVLLNTIDERYKDQELSQSKIVGAVAQTVTQTREQLEAQKLVKAVFGDQTDVIEDANKKKEKAAKLGKDSESIDEALLKLRQDMFKIDQDRGDEAQRLYKEALKQLELDEKQLETQQKLAEAVQQRREAAQIQIEDRDLQSEFDRATTQEEAQSVLDKRYAKQIERLNSETLLYEEYTAKKKDIDAKYEADSQALAEESMRKKLEIMNLYYQSANDLAQFATNIGLISAEKAFNIQKGVAATETAINTIVTVQKTLSQTGLYGAPLAAAQAVAGAARVAAILSMPFNGAGGRSQTGRTMADGRGSVGEGFRVDPLGTQRGGQSAVSTSTPLFKQAPTVVIQSQLNQDVLAYNVREGEANIRQTSTILSSDPV